MLRDDNMNRLRFDSLPEMVQWIRSNAMHERHLTSGDRWYGSSGERALHCAIVGDDANVPAAQAMMDKFSADIALKSMADEPTVAGCYPVVAEFLSGEPECMRMPTPVASDAAPLSVFVDLTCSADISTDKMRTRGVAILASLMALSAIRPITLEVGCVMGCDRKADGLGKDRASFVSVVLDTSPLDLSTAAWMLSDVAAARRLMYGTSAVLHGFDGGWPSFNGVEYGAVESDAHCERVRQHLGLPGDTLYIPAVCTFGAGNSTDVFKNPLAWCQQIVRRFGGSLNDE